MEKIEFRPTKALLIFRLLGVILVSAPIGGVISAGFTETNVPVFTSFSIGSLIPFVLLAAYTMLYFFSIRYELDDRYISRSSGVLWKQRRSIPLEKITNLDVRQGPIERILGYGKIWVFTPSTGAATPEEKLVGIPHPHDMKETMIERSEAAKQPAVQENSMESTNEVVSLLTDIRDSLKRIESSIPQNNGDASLA